MRENVVLYLCSTMLHAHLTNSDGLQRPMVTKLKLLNRSNNIYIYILCDPRFDLSKMRITRRIQRDCVKGALILTPFLVSLKAPGYRSSLYVDDFVVCIEEDLGRIRSLKWSGNGVEK